MKNLASINVFTDGGSRGNPGESALGVYIETIDKKEIYSVGKRIGINTNNIAEYSAIAEALRWIKNNLDNLESLKMINFFMDSNLAVNQLNGLYKIKNSNIRIIYFEIKTIESEIKIPIIYKHIPREQNKNADRQVNLALDNKI